jgi:hypothetical protein
MILLRKENEVSNINAYIFKTEFDTYIIDLWEEGSDLLHKNRRRLDLWECRLFRYNSKRKLKYPDSILRITSVTGGYKLDLEHDGNVAAAYLCRKVFIEMGVKDVNIQPK